jgi:hypothetical protein
VDATKATAHRAGILYFVFMIIAIIREFVFPAFMVVGDASATAHNITAAEPMYRLGILLSFVTLVMFIFLVGLLYQLFRDVDRGYATAMMLLVTGGVALALANLVSEFAPLVLFNGADYWLAFSKPQLDALALGALRLHSAGAAVTTVFWGLWLFPFGILVIKSGFFPRILGYLLVVAGCAYVTYSVTAITLPEYRQAVARLMMPLYFGEVPIIFWLMIKGARVPPPIAR